MDAFNTQPANSGTGPSDVALVGKTRSGAGGSSPAKIAVGVLALLAILAAIAALLFLFVLKQPDPDPGLAVSTTPPASIAATSTELPAVQRQAEALDDTFAFRNIFAPAVDAPYVPPAGTAAPAPGGAAAPPSDSAIPANTLFLQAIATVDGQSAASFIWNGLQYVVTPGQDLPGTPWHLVSISGNTATMLYGDIRVTVTVGQGITK